nr:DUF2027 domain-containing protein [Bacteroidales bacterium]
ILSSTQATVRIEDDFDIPVLISELIKVPEEFIKKINGTENQAEQTSTLGSKTISTSDNIPEGIYLSFIPVNQVVIFSNIIEIYIINNTANKLLYSIHSEKIFKNIVLTGILEKKSKIPIATVNYNELKNWTEFVIQVIYACKDKIIEPVSEHIKLDLSLLLKESNYKDNIFFQEKAYTIIINDLSEVEQLFTDAEEEYEENTIIPEQLNDILQKQKEEQNQIDKLKEFISKYKTDEKSAVIDMHIWEITENSNKLSPSEIFNIQISFFNKCLESALLNKLSNVVFIHGVGNGILKKEIRLTLAKDYPEIKVFDASMAKYGVGATEIQIPFNY